jgi:hypothetical protein
MRTFDLTSKCLIPEFRQWKQEVRRCDIDHSFGWLMLGTFGEWQSRWVSLILDIHVISGRHLLRGLVFAYGSAVREQAKGRTFVLIATAPGVHNAIASSLVRRAQASPTSARANEKNVIANELADAESAMVRRLCEARSA